MDTNNFINILMENTPESMMKFLLEKGKKPKVISPIYFENKESEEEKDDERK